MQENAINDMNEKPRNKKKAPKYTPLEKIIELRRRGLTMEEVGKILGISKVAVFYRLQGLDFEREDIEEYKKSRADFLAGLQLRFLSSLTDSEIRKINALQRITSVGILYDKERLERNLATSNQQVIILQVPDSKAQYEQMRAEREKALAVREDEPADDERALFSPPADNPVK